MSNTYYAETRIVEERKTGTKTNEIVVHDSYGEDIYTVASFTDSDLDNLEMCIKEELENPWQGHEVLQGLFEGEHGIIIDGTPYEWEEIKHLATIWNER